MKQPEKKIHSPTKLSEQDQIKPASLHELYPDLLTEKNVKLTAKLLTLHQRYLRDYSQNTIPEGILAFLRSYKLIFADVLDVIDFMHTIPIELLTPFANVQNIQIINPDFLKKLESWANDNQQISHEDLNTLASTFKSLITKKSPESKQPYKIDDASIEEIQENCLTELNSISLANQLENELFIPVSPPATTSNKTASQSHIPTYSFPLFSSQISTSYSREPVIPTRTREHNRSPCNS